jgi:hypothetical protein
MTHERRAYQSAVHIALSCVPLPEAAADEVARAQGLLMRNTGYDLDDAREALLRAATLIPAKWSDAMMAEVIVEHEHRRLNQ